jgi:hypothetical protein
MRNEDIAFPAYLSTFLDERTAALEDELRRATAEEPPALSEEDSRERAEVQRRLLEKLGILSEVEELYEINQRSRSQA